MLTPTINNVSQQSQASQTDRTNLGQKDIFLKLLVAQMKNQDPLKPQDATQMSSQLAQFNMVEQQTNTNTLLQQLVNTGGAGNSGIANEASYLGRTVTVNQSSINFDGTTQPAFNVVLDSQATTTLVSITDANGNVVRTAQIDGLNAGNNSITWDGITDSGTTAPQGIYNVSANANDINGNSIGAAVQRTGIVDAVRYSAGGTELMIGGMAAATTDITEIRL